MGSYGRQIINNLQSLSYALPCAANVDAQLSSYREEGVSGVSGVCVARVGTGEVACERTCRRDTASHDVGDRPSQPPSPTIPPI